MNYLFVFLGGGLGAVCRYGISKLVQTSSAFPYATFLANVISCIILGFLLGTLLQKELSTKTQLLLMTGFCGGFSTFSTFTAESYELLESGQITIALLYILSSLIVCLICLGIGIKVAQALA